MVKFSVNDIMCVKRKRLDEYLPCERAHDYKLGNFIELSTGKSYPMNACKILEWKISTAPGSEDPVMVKVEMLYDRRVWEFPSRLLYPYIKNVEFSDTSDCCGSTKIYVSNENFGNMGYVSNTYTKKYYGAQEEGVMNSFYVPKRIIYNNPATIVFWKDGTKTVVKKAAKEPYNKYNAFCAALAKKVYGNNSRVNSFVASGEDQVKRAKSHNPNFVRDEKGRWVSKKLKNKDGNKK